MADTTFRHGDPDMIDYTPSGGNVAAGEVVILGNTAGLTCGVAHVPIENGIRGALGSGGGFYEGINLNNAANFAVVYWDNTNKKFTTVSTNNAKFGFITRDGGGGANTNCIVRHFPFV